MEETTKYVSESASNFPEKNTPKLQKTSIIMLVFSLLIVLTGFIYWLSINKNKSVSKQTTNTESIIQKNPTESHKQDEDKLFIKSDVCKISFSVPRTWEQIEFTEENDVYNYGCRFNYFTKGSVDGKDTGNFLIHSAQSDSLETLVDLSLATGKEERVVVKGADKAVKIITTELNQDSQLKNPVTTIVISKEESNYVVVFGDIDRRSTEIFNKVVDSINLFGQKSDYQKGFYAYSMLKKLKDSKVKNDLQTIKFALSEYYKDNNKYPDTLDRLKESGYVKASYSFVNPITKEIYNYKADPKFESFKIYATDGAGMDIGFGAQ